LKVGDLYSFGERHVLVPAMDALRASVGLPADPDGAMLFRYCYFLAEPPGLQSATETLPPTAVRLRHVVFDQSGPEVRPDWLADLAEHPTVYATAGTGFNKTPGLLEDILAALRDEPIDEEAILSDAEVGPEVHRLILAADAAQAFVLASPNYHNPVHHHRRGLG